MNLAVARRRVDAATISSVRPLTTEDLAFLRTGHATIDPIKRIRDRHHHIAWLLALGRSHKDIAAEVHLNPERISIYLRDPTFSELIARYREEIAESRRQHTDDFVAKATETMKLAEAEVQKRIESDPDSVHIRDLNRIAADRMDRFGYGKHTTSETRNINVNFAAKLEAAIERSRKTIEGN